MFECRKAMKERDDARIEVARMRDVLEWTENNLHWRMCWNNPQSS
jgi:hypothetical protein